MDSPSLGLTSKVAENKLQKFGPNSLPESKSILFIKIFKSIFSPISIMLLVAGLLSFFVGKTFDGNFILILLLINISITLWQERKADSAIKKLNGYLQQETLVLRDNKWQKINSANLVVGDIIKIQSGEVIPADATVLEANNVSVNESAITGESFPIQKSVDSQIFSGSYLVKGITIAKITATGPNTNFGKAVFKVERSNKQSLLEKDIIRIAEFLSLFSLTAVVILTAVFYFQGIDIFEILTFNLSIIIAGIPISLATVMTLIAEFGVLNLAKKNIIIRRISALEDLSNINFLLTDKTGTLTQNKIQINHVFAYGNYDENKVLEYVSIVAEKTKDDPIDKAILDKVKSENLEIPKHKEVNFIPPDSDRKRSTLKIFLEGNPLTISIGAPQIIESFCNLNSTLKKKFNTDVQEFAKKGNRTIAVAISDDKEENMQLIGLLSLSDTVRPEAKSVIEFLKENGISTSMVTGDNRAIANQISHEIFLNDGRVITKSELDKVDFSSLNKNFFLETGVFAEILPNDKLKLVEKAKQFFTVASTGDGVNDLPAVKTANVGIAVSNSVNVLKSGADIVLLAEGIEVIKDVIIESRKIFQRIYTYSIYRISESFRLVVALAILGIFFKEYPLTPLQIILIALLNDLPIISLAYDRVKSTAKPERLNLKKQLTSSTLFGFVGILNSLLILVVCTQILHLSWETIQTIYFLKLTVSGHMLIFVVHTKEKWFKFLPSKEVMFSTFVTQIIATLLAFSGFLMPARLSIGLIVFIWIWSFFWMQVSELMKYVKAKQ